MSKENEETLKVYDKKAGTYLATSITPTIVLAGEKDIIKMKHTKLIANTIPNSKLEIIKNEDHGSYIINTDKIYNIIKKYI